MITRTKLDPHARSFALEMLAAALGSVAAYAWCLIFFLK